MFRRRRRENQDAPSDPAEEILDDLGEPESHQAVAVGPTASEPAGLPPRPDGPWDLDEAPDTDVERFDLGGLRLAIPDGAQVQLDVTPDGTVVPTLIIGEGGVQISAFAAPRRTGIWAEVRAEIAESLQEAGGEIAEAEGTFGTELHGQVPVQDEAGNVGFQPARFVGVDGPRWFLRGLFTGEAVSSGAAAELEAAVRGTVVVRGSEAMAPRDPLPLSVPQEIMEAAGVPTEELAPTDPAAPGSASADSDAIRPFERGPEITEVR